MSMSTLTFIPTWRNRKTVSEDTEHRRARTLNLVMVELRKDFSKYLASLQMSNLHTTPVGNGAQHST
ncbi:MAG: hypothetical protein ACJA08_003067 [Cyclobacteriaceae bacterium]|jgi:hypothetical protein